MTALIHKDPIWADQITMSTRALKRAKIEAAANLRARQAANMNIARALDPAPVGKAEIEVFECASGHRYYEKVRDDGSKVRLPYLSILR